METIKTAATASKQAEDDTIYTLLVSEYGLTRDRLEFNVWLVRRVSRLVRDVWIITGRPGLILKRPD